MSDVWEIRATHRGNFKEHFGIDVECYVLDDAQKTAVISKRGMSEALGLDKSSGTALTRFVRGAKMASYLGGELLEKLENPLVFQWKTLGESKPQPEVDIHGYDVTILIDICRAIIQAHENKELTKRQDYMAKQARVIINASAKAGIKGLVYALSGYDATKEEFIQAFKFYVREQAREYEKEFPDELYREWYRLYDLPKPARNRPWKFRHLTIKHVYEPLANSDGKILSIARNRKMASKASYARLHQFLQEIGVKVLRVHLGRLLGIAEMSASKDEYEANVAKVFGAQQENNKDKVT